MRSLDHATTKTDMHYELSLEDKELLKKYIHVEGLLKNKKTVVNKNNEEFPEIIKVLNRTIGK